MMRNIILPLSYRFRNHHHRAILESVINNNSPGIIINKRMFVSKSRSRNLRKRNDWKNSNKKKYQKEDSIVTTTKRVDEKITIYNDYENKSYVRPILFLVVAPVLAWSIVVIGRPDLREKFLSDFGLNKDSEEMQIVPNDK